jgi:AraC-type DNA-binding domain-containing proteins
MSEKIRDIENIISFRRMRETDPNQSENKDCNYRHIPQMFNADWTRKVNQADPIHWHEYIEFIYILDGEAEVKIGEEMVFAGAGEMVIINSGEIHRILAGERDLSYHCLTATFELCAKLGFPADEIKLKSKLPVDDTIRKFVTDIEKEYADKRLGFVAYANSLFSLLFIYLCRTCSEEALKNNVNNKKALAKTRVVKNAINYIHNHISENITTSDICRDTFVSISHLCHCFKEAIGLTPVEYINKLRCELAKSMLSKSTYSIHVVSEMLGFQSLSYFNRQYKKNCGYAPSKTKRTNNMNQHN